MRVRMMTMRASLRQFRCLEEGGLGSGDGEMDGSGREVSEILRSKGEVRVSLIGNILLIINRVIFN